MNTQRKQLKRISLSESAFIKILSATQFKEKVEDISRFALGYYDNYIIRYTDDSLICKLNFLVYAGVLPQEELNTDRDWYQVLCVRDDAQQRDWGKLDNPAASCRRIKRILHKHYTDDEIIEIYKTHECDNSSIIHVPAYTVKDSICIFENCYQYDICGAYASVLVDMFPKCRGDFAYMYLHRHDDNNRFKNDFNFFVGCLTQNEKKRIAKSQRDEDLRDIFPRTRHYIVNRISEKLIDFERNLGGEQVIYENTDGLIVQNPKKYIKSSTKIGEFKLEYFGTVYTYKASNYWLIQLGNDPMPTNNDMKGNIPLSLRDRIDLSSGKVISYKKTLVNGVYQYEDIKEVYINEQNIYKNI